LIYTYVISYHRYVIVYKYHCLCMSFLKLLRAVLRASESYLLNSPSQTLQKVLQTACGRSERLLDCLELPALEKDARGVNPFFP